MEVQKRWLLMAAGLLWSTSEALAKNDTAEALGNFLGGFVSSASDGDAQKIPMSAEALEKQRVAEEKVALAQSAMEQARQMKVKCEMAKAKAEAAKEGERAQKTAEEASEACDDYTLAQKIADQYATEAKIAVLEAKVARYESAAPAMREGSGANPEGWPFWPVQPLSSEDSNEGEAYARQMMLEALNLSCQATCANKNLESLKNLAQRFKGTSAESRTSQAVRRALERYQKLQSESDRYSAEASRASKGKNYEAQKDTEVSNPEYRPDPITGFEARLALGGFVGPYGAKGSSIVGPATSMHLGYHSTQVGIFATTYGLKLLGDDAEPHTGDLYGGQLELHFFVVNNPRLNFAVQFGGGAGHFTFHSKDQSGKEVKKGEWAPVGKVGLGLDIMITRHIYIPVDLGGEIYAGTSDNLVPFGFINAYTGIGFVY